MTKANVGDKVLVTNEDLGGNDGERCTIVDIHAGLYRVECENGSFGWLYAEDFEIEIEEETWARD